MMGLVPQLSYVTTHSTAPLYSTVVAKLHINVFVRSKLQICMQIRFALNAKESCSFCLKIDFKKLVFDIMLFFSSFFFCSATFLFAFQLIAPLHFQNERSVLLFSVILHKTYFLAINFVCFTAATTEIRQWYVYARSLIL